MTRWVVKVGSQMVCSGGPIQIRSWMQQILNLKKNYSIEIVWVTSGAIASAVERTDFKKAKSDWKLAEKQALSAIGQPLLMDQYNLALHSTGLLGAQVLLTSKDLNHKAQRQNFQKTLEQLLKWGVVPILNENDAVATDEIKFGDNDSLSAQVASHIGADRLVILTDVEGLYDQDPKKHRDAKLLGSIKKVTPQMLTQVAKSAKSSEGHGTGGMFSKLQAARLASHSKIETVLVKGDLPNVLIEIAKGSVVGTRVGSQGKTKR